MGRRPTVTLGRRQRCPPQLRQAGLVREGWSQVAVTMVEAINAALRDAMVEDPRVLVFGEDVGRLGGVFRVTEGLQERFGRDRCFDTPLAESGIVGISIGLAL